MAGMTEIEFTSREDWGKLRIPLGELTGGKDMFTTEWKIGMMEFDEVRAIREAVFAQELSMPAEQVFDWEDGIAAHLLVRLQDGTPVATARIYPKDGDTAIGCFAVLSEYRRQGYGDVCLRLLLYKALHLPGARVVAEVPEKYLPYYNWFGFEAVGEAQDGIVPMAIAREKIHFPSECGHNH